MKLLINDKIILCKNQKICEIHKIDEHFRLMGFKMTDDYQEILFPPTQNYTRLGRRAGNGWDVNLTGILMHHIFSQLPEFPDPIE